MSSFVLVVEDEPLIRMVAVETLADDGFAAEEAGSAGAALEMLSKLPGKFGAVIIDIGLPDRSGDELAAELRKTWNSLPIIIASGHDGSRLPQWLHDDPFIRLVAKPYDNTALSSALGDLGVARG
jgi:DNA-binding response OmpR family regulator